MKDNIPKRVVAAIMLTLLVACSVQPDNSNKPIAILGAFSDEIAMLVEKLEKKKVIIEGGIEFIQGELSGKEVVVAFTGIGKVNAAMTTTLMLEYFNPSVVLFTGIAGGINSQIQPADMLISERCVQHDLNYIYDDTLISYQPVNPVTHQTNPVFFYADSYLIALAKELSSGMKLSPVIAGEDTLYPTILFGTIATGDAFVSSKLKKEELIERFQADAVEMEGAAVAQICHQRDIPFLIIRSISDSADENADTDLEAYYLTAAKNANRIVVELVEAMER